MALLIGICGGIGSGKSIVSRLLRSIGFEVYDCDVEAKALMSRSETIKKRICNEISKDVTDGIREPDRRLLADIVFSDELKRRTLNEIVHGAVLNDVEKWRAERSGEKVFVEAAVLAESGLAEICDQIWQVVADPKERIRRIVARDGSSIEHAELRIKSQQREENLLMAYKDKIQKITNDAQSSLLAQVGALVAI